MRQSLKTWLLLAGVFVLVAGATAYLTLRRTGVKMISADVSGDIQARQVDRAEGMAGKIAPSQAILAYLKAPSAGTLEKALRASLSLAARNPDDLLNKFLLAFCYHEMKDPAAEASVLAKCRPEERDIYRFCFYEHRDGLADALYYMPAYLCGKLREGHNAIETFPPGAKCPFFGGPISGREYLRGKRTVTRFFCPKCDGMIKLREDAVMGNVIDHRVNKENPLISIFPHLAVLLEDRKWGRSDKSGAVTRLVSILGVKEGMTVADIGAGIGQFSFRFAEKVGPKGKVYAEDIDESFIKLLGYCVKKGAIGNIVPVLGTPDDMKLPPGKLDLAALIHVYWSIALVMDERSPKEREAFFDSFLGAIHRSLKKDGVLALVDHVDPQLGLSPDNVIEEMKKRNFRLLDDKGKWKGRDFVFLFQKAEPAGR